MANFDAASKYRYAISSTTNLEHNGINKCRRVSRYKYEADIFGGELVFTSIHGPQVGIHKRVRKANKMVRKLNEHSYEMEKT